MLRSLSLAGDGARPKRALAAAAVRMGSPAVRSMCFFRRQPAASRATTGETNVKPWVDGRGTIFPPSSLLLLPLSLVRSAPSFSAYLPAYTTAIFFPGGTEWIKQQGLTDLFCRPPDELDMRSSLLSPLRRHGFSHSPNQGSMSHSISYSHPARGMHLSDDISTVSNHHLPCARVGRRRRGLVRPGWLSAEVTT